MNKKHKIAFIGGDLRQIRVINGFAESGNIVSVYGFEKCNNSDFSDTVAQAETVEKAITDSDIIILPLPYKIGQDIVNSPFSYSEIYVSDVIKRIKSEQILFVGKADEQIIALAELYNIHLTDYMEREELAVLNAIPTAEGAIEIAMREMPITIHSSNCLVLGYGRIGKTLSKMLSGLCANVSVAARNYSDFAWIKLNGYEALDISDLSKVLGKFDIIFNTVPNKILDFKYLSKIRKDSLVIDLASRPGGVDFETAKELNIQVIWALSLPGKTSPSTAGDIIKDTVTNILEELGV